MSFWDWIFETKSMKRNPWQRVGELVEKYQGKVKGFEIDTSQRTMYSLVLKFNYMGSSAEERFDLMNSTDAIAEKFIKRVEDLADKLGWDK